MHEVDVAILGGGLAGNLLARQLRREVPDASVAVFERSPERGYKVGESTVEIATNYLVRRQGLSTYIYKEHLPKNGLRYFFDNEAKDAKLWEMSEIGVDGLPPYPSFQLDRARLERDLLEMNAKDGVDIHLPARVTNLQLSDDGKHTFDVVEGDRKTSWKARWVIDGTGREAMIAKLKGLRVREPNHKIASAWGRFHGVTDVDDYGPEEWRARARYTARALSTIHFMYEGCWIWFIPLREGITSLGIVQETSRWSADRFKPEGFLGYLREHGAIRDLVNDVEVIDLEGYTQLAFRTKQWYSGDERWACIGDSAAFSDPFYSPGSDFIATGNDLVADMIRRDLAGEDVGERGRLYDAYMQYRFDSTLVIYDQLYPTFGSFELYEAKVFFDTACYYNLLFDAYAQDLHRDERWLRTQLRRREWVMQALGNFGQLFRGAAEEMKKRGTYYRKNTGESRLSGRKSFGVMEEVGAPRSRREVNEVTEQIFQRTQQMVGSALDDDSALVQRLLQGSRELYDAWGALAE
ncbi:MAG: FAD-dependent monooxygenase [Myxococcales bacterium]|nr:FAD-dependent monooxygenase [Myxococcales bacterium]